MEDCPDWDSRSTDFDQGFGGSQKESSVRQDHERFLQLNNFRPQEHDVGVYVSDTTSADLRFRHKLNRPTISCFITSQTIFDFPTTVRSSFRDTPDRGFAHVHRFQRQHLPAQQNAQLVVEDRSPKENRNCRHAITNARYPKTEIAHCRSIWTI